MTSFGRYFPIALVFAIMILFASVGLGWSYTAKTEAREELEKSEKEVKLKKIKVSGKKSSMSKDDSLALAIDDFLAKWEPHLDKYEEDDDRITALVNNIDRLAVDYRLATSDKITPASPQKYPFRSETIRVQSIGVTASGELVNALNWLSELESTLPLARIERLSVTGYSKSSVSIALRLSFPVDLIPEPEPEKPAKKKAKKK